MWDKSKLTDLAKERGEALSYVEGALLAFARAHELTDEHGIDPRRAKNDLEAALESIGPETADRLRNLGSFQRDEVLRDFLKEMLDHNQRRIERELEEVRLLAKDRDRDGSTNDEDDEDSGHRSRRRSR